MQAASALANPNLKRNTITWQGRKAHASGALMEGADYSSALATLPSPLFDTEDYLRNGKK